MVADAEAILLAHRAAILAKAVRDYPLELVEEWAPTLEEKRLNNLQAQIDDPDHIWFVADLDGDILGFAQAQPAQKELTACYVKPNLVGRVGSQLLKALESAVYKDGFTVLEMDASINAVSFYQNHGYVLLEHGEHRLNSGAVMACAKMRKTLGDVD
jgi:putative acetyltransferase